MSCNNYTATQIPVSVGFDAEGNAGSLIETKEIKVTKIETPTDTDQLIIAAGAEVVFKGNVSVEGTINVGAVQAASSLSSLTDVNITSVANGEVLVWSSNDWINRTLSEAGIVATGDLANYATTGSLTGYVPTGTLSNYVQTTALNNYVATTSVGVTVQAQDPVLDALSLATVTANTVAYFNTGAAATTTTLTPFARTDLLAATGAGPIRASLDLEPGTDIQVQNDSLQDIADIDTTGLADGDILKWNKGLDKWEAAAETGGGGATLNDLTDVTISTATNNDFLVYNGSQWANQGPSVARTSLGATTVGSNIITLSNPGAVRYLKINANNTVSTRTAAEMQSDLSVTPGTNVQTQNANLQSIANQTTTANTLIYFSGSASAATTTLTQFGISLLDDANAIECRSTLSAQLSSVPLDNLTNLCTGAGSTGASAYGRLFYTVNSTPATTTLAQVPLFDTGTIANNYGKVLKLVDAAPGTPGQLAAPSWGSVAQSEITGLTTADTPTFAGLNVGNADTAITRTSAGNIAVAGQTIYRQGGTDVAIADGGTGIGTTPTAGQVLVGQSGGTYALESGSTLRTSIGAQAADATLTALAGVTTANDTIIYFNGVDSATSTGLTAAGRKIISCPDTLATGDIFYYDGTNVKKLGKPTNPAALVFEDGANAPKWVQVPDKTNTYFLKSTAGSLSWGGV